MAQAAAVYCRISDDREGRQLGVGRQREDCLAVAAQRGWTVAELYVDNDVSAYSGKPRPEYRRMLRDLKEGTRDGVIVYHQDRLVRQPRELEEFFDICDAAGVTQLASVSGDLDLSNDDHRVIARILGALAQKESNDKSRRIRRKHQEIAEAGEVTGGGTRPFGFEEDRKTIRQTEARIIRNLVKRRLAGESIRSLCRFLNEKAIPTVTGKPWSPQVVTRMLLSARISGQREHRGEIVAIATWPAIITPEQTAKLRGLAGQGRRAPRTPRRYLLSRLLRCSRCGATMVSRPREDGARRYVCAKGPGLAGCNGTFILARDLELFVVEAVLYRLDTSELQTALRGEVKADAAARSAQGDLDAALAQADELALAYANRDISMREWRLARQPIEDRVEALKKTLSRATRTTALANYVGHSATLRRQWADLDLSRQQAIVRALVDYITVGPGVRGRNTFDPTRFTPTWKR
ncbi:MAG: hypothetical protein QOE83_1601 [Actinomycetota bacterium]|jgi:DNA invertase Pin-like site-specific DNA recombinase|nr:hypothetical protein [Actinomycetota bacterium]